MDDERTWSWLRIVVFETQRRLRNNPPELLIDTSFCASSPPRMMLWCSAMICSLSTSWEPSLKTSCCGLLVIAIPPMPWKSDFSSTYPLQYPFHACDNCKNKSQAKKKLQEKEKRLRRQRDLIKLCQRPSSFEHISDNLRRMDLVYIRSELQDGAKWKVLFFRSYGWKGISTKEIWLAQGSKAACENSNGREEKELTRDAC